MRLHFINLMLLKVGTKSVFSHGSILAVAALRPLGTLAVASIPKFCRATRTILSGTLTSAIASLCVNIKRLSDNLNFLFETRLSDLNL